MESAGVVPRCRGTGLQTFWQRGGVPYPLPAHPGAVGPSGPVFSPLQSVFVQRMAPTAGDFAWDWFAVCRPARR
eukprot:10439546-Lingulodinium_polyedra.AAC.1